MKIIRMDFKTYEEDLRQAREEALPVAIKQLEDVVTKLRDVQKLRKTNRTYESELFVSEAINMLSRTILGFKNKEVNK